MASAVIGSTTLVEVSANPAWPAQGGLVRSHVEVLQMPALQPSLPFSSQKPATHIATYQGKQDRFLRRTQTLRLPSRFNNPKLFFCYRCGDRGHRAISCRNALVCFTCGRLGHRSVNCRSIPHLPSLIQPVVCPQMADPIPAPMIRVSPNRDNQILQERLMNCLVLYDTYNLGSSYVKSQLARIFKEVTKPWVVKTMPDQKLLVEPPDLG